MTVSDCRRVRVLLDAFVDGELEPRQRVVVRRHLDACARCRHEVETRRALGTLIHVTLRGRAGMTAEQIAALHDEED